MDVLGYYHRLDSKGTVKEPAAIAAALFQVPFVSNYSQSTMYLGKVSSIGHVYQQSGASADSFPAQIEAMYTTLFLRYFARVLVTVKITDGGDGSEYSIDIEYGDGSETARLSDTIFNRDGIIEYSNLGEVT